MVDKDLEAKIEERKQQATKKSIYSQALEITAILGSIASAEDNFTGNSYEQEGKLLKGTKKLFIYTDGADVRVHILYDSEKVFEASGSTPEEVYSYIPGKWEEIIAKKYEDINKNLGQYSRKNVTSKEDEKKKWGL